jgi:DNA-binding Lrp family transcriptional regulator
MNVDSKDRQILSALDMNARIPFTTLAKRVKVSRQVVEYRIKKLEKENIILGYKTIFDSAVVGIKWYRVTFRLLNITKQEKKVFMEYLKNHNYTGWLGEVGGNWDIILNFMCRDNFEFNKIFEEIIATYGKYIRDYEILIYINVYDFERTYIQDIKNKRKKFFHEMKYNHTIHLDILDKKIIQELANNARISNIELARKFKVTPNTIKNRINIMIQHKLILGFRMVINPSLYGYTSHLLFLEITRLNLQKERELLRYIKTIPNIIYIVKHIGRWRIGLEIETQNTQEFQDIFVDIRGRFSDIITDFEIFPLFKDHKLNYFPEGNLI